MKEKCERCGTLGVHYCTGKHPKPLSIYANASDTLDAVDYEVGKYYTNVDVTRINMTFEEIERGLDTSPVDIALLKCVIAAMNRQNIKTKLNEKKLN